LPRFLRMFPEQRLDGSIDEDAFDVRVQGKRLHQRPGPRSIQGLGRAALVPTGSARVVEADVRVATGLVTAMRPEVAAAARRDVPDVELRRAGELLVHAGNGPDDGPDGFVGAPGVL